MRILIIGGTGLISNFITAQLLEQGHDVHIFNRGRTSGLAPDLTPGVPVIVGDRTSRKQFAERIRGLPDFDAVIDMVCYLPDDARQLVDVFQGRTGHLLLCSTVDVYAKPPSRYPIREDELHAPLNDYGRNKSECERIAMDASSARFPVTVIRPAHTYGPGSAHRGHIVHTFGGRSFVADRIQKGKPVVVHGDGTSLWTSGYAEDVAAAFTGAVGNRKAFGNAYHVTGDEWLTWNRYFELVARAMGAAPPELVHIPTETLVQALPNRARILGENFQFHNIFDLSAAAADLGFRNRSSFLEGMTKTIAWVKAGPGFENCEGEHWYDRLIAEWRGGRDAFVRNTSGLDT